MTQASEEKRKEEVLQAVIERVHERWPAKEAKQVERFVQEYYAAVAPEDIADSRISNLYGAALSHWSLGARYRRGEPLIHVYNPDPEQNGWECTHSVIQLITDDKPFLVDSVSMALNRHGLTIHLIIHPVLAVVRDDEGRIQEVHYEAGKRTATDEAWMHFEVDHQTEPDRLQAVHDDIAAVLEDVRVAVEDWRPMGERLTKVIDELESSKTSVDKAELDEAAAFLRWVGDNHFTFLGYRRYELRRLKQGDELRAVADSGLGVLRGGGERHSSSSFAALPDDVRSRARDPNPLTLTKSSNRARVHRPSYMDFVGVKRYNAKGEVIGEHRFLGLFTSAAYHHDPRKIPLLRQKVKQILQWAQLPSNSHDGKALINILETYPRDELFQADTRELFEAVRGILRLQERQRVRLFVRYDNFRRFVSCLVYAPRERYNTEIRERMQTILLEAFDGAHCEFNVQLSESVLARIHFIIHLKEPGQPDYDHANLERRLAQTMRSWTDDLAEALLDYYGEERGKRLYGRYGKGFSAAYREDVGPRTAAHDIERLETLREADDLAISLYRPLEAARGLLRLKLFRAGKYIPLSDALPVLEHMGVRVVDERPYDVQRQDNTTCWIHDFGLSYAGADELEAERVRDAFQAAFAAVWHRQAEDDGLNHLVLAARLKWREIVILRAYTRYLRQVGTPFSQRYVEDTLAGNPAITPLLVRLFFARFDPENRDDKRAASLVEEVEGLLDEVASLDQDRILRRLLAAIQATLRTNYFRTDSEGNERGYLSLKLQPSAIPHMPKPVPAFEIFVYSPRMEGVHLRGGKVARGGIRWSDRREDFRTEILGLMKAQMVKNAVIVPVGAKGGFVCKQLPDEREALQTEVLDCYRTLIRGLLDVTDNIVDGSIVGPDEVVRHDEDDHYLVVAADKGTATFSDFANEIAEEYGFWLHDAFASGGSTGYDHKKMAITARGAWEAVKRHFREMGHDTQSEPFTVVGVGDMSGDVFGNGMLLSKQIRLVASFDHRHIFVDPNPDPAVGFAERQRLFNKQRSTWDDYDRDKISKGGGIWPRTTKSISINKEMREALGTDAHRLSPNELMNAILRAPADLFWNGGIGTYIKAADESHADVGDKANDAIRVDACELRCRVVGEGGNLGVTQRGRVEFAWNDGRINTDAIDNAGGVDCSDHEVNIKILLNRVVDNGDLTMKQRNRLLRDMTEEVADLVLASNYRQTQALTLLQARAPELLDEQARFMRELERDGRLDRVVEQLPDDEDLVDRHKAHQGLTRPELSVLLAYAKIRGYEALLNSDLVNADYLVAELMDYFPGAIRERFRGPVGDHPLRAEIIATGVANDVINHMGATFLFRIESATGADTADTARAYFAARGIFGLGELWREVDALDNKVGAEIQNRMLHSMGYLQERAALWLLRNLASPLDIEETIQRLRPAVSQLEESLDDLLAETDTARLQQEVDALSEAGVSETLARRIGRVESLYASLDLMKVCTATNSPLDRTAAIYFSAGTQLELDWLREALAAHEADDPWQERYRAGLEEEFYVQLRRLTFQVVSSESKTAADKRSGASAVESWIADNQALVTRLRRTLIELRGAAQVDLPMLGVALQELRNLARAGDAQQVVSSDDVAPPQAAAGA